MRWKGSEKGALSMLTDDDAQRVTPIIEFVPKPFDKFDSSRAVEKAVKDVALHWGKRFAYVDLSLLDAKCAELAWPFVRRQCDYYACDIGIVTKVGSNCLPIIKQAFPEHTVALRLTISDLCSSNLKATVDDYFRSMQKSASQVSLIVDCGAIHHEGFLIANYVNKVPYRDDWKELIVLSGAFPQNLIELKKNSQHKIMRFDWLAWLEYANQKSNRTASYGDYNIFSSDFKDEEGKKRNFSASLKYTSNDYWVVMRGEGVKNEDGPGYQQYPAQAFLLCEREEFMGPDYSPGDRFLYDMGQQTLSTGQLKQWMQATINHHLTFVPRQIAATFGN